MSDGSDGFYFESDQEIGYNNLNFFEGVEGGEEKGMEEEKEDGIDEDEKESKSFIPIKPLENRTTGLTGNNEFIIEEIKVNQNENNTKKKRKRKRKSDDEGNQNENKGKKTRGDNIFKQIKIHGINFSFDTLNELMDKVEFNSFIKFDKNKINDDFKSRVEQEYNLAIIGKSIRDIIYDYHKDKDKDDTNIKVIEKFKEYVVEKKIENNNFVLMFNRFLDTKFSEIIKIFNMSKEEYKNKFDLENNFLLESKDKIKNKNDLKDLIVYGVSHYLKEKKKRKNKKKINIH